MRERTGLQPSRRVLPNGVTVLAKANHTTPQLSLLIGVKAGAYADPPDREGTAALVARVLDRGTITRSADVIADDLDGRGASLSVVAGRHQMALSATCLTEDFTAVLDLAADVVRHPAFPDAEVATRRVDLITSIRQQEDNPATEAVDTFARALYGDHPYARKVRGTVASVERLKRSDLVAFHEAWFALTDLTVVVVGDIDETAALDSVARAFQGSIEAKVTGDRSSVGEAAAGQALTAEVPEPPKAHERKLVSVPMMDKAQTDIAYGFVGIRRSDPDFTAVSLMNNALGQYALGGRLGDSIRERQGMAYYVFSSLEAGLGPGPLMIRAGVSAENVERTIASIDEELTSIRRDGFTPKEIDDSKRYLIGSLPRQLETNAAIATFLLGTETYNLGLDYDVRLPDLLNAVTLDHANLAARRLLDAARATIAVAGPWTSEASPQLPEEKRVGSASLGAV
ncbi:MAG: M16 family metallopeptidase [Vicinamibacterales bacterium]